MHLWPDPLTLYHQGFVHVNLLKLRYPLGSVGNVEGEGVTLVCNLKTFYSFVTPRKSLFNLYLKIIQFSSLWHIALFHSSHLRYFITAFQKAIQDIPLSLILHIIAKLNTCLLVFCVFNKRKCKGKATNDQNRPIRLQACHMPLAQCDTV